MTTNITKSKRLTARQTYHLAKEYYTHRLRFNLLSKKVELDGQEYILENAKYTILQDYGYTVSQKDAVDVFTFISKNTNYDPVRNYLEYCHLHITPINIDNLSSRYLGTSNPLYDLFFKKTLISAVARIYDIGCKVDTALILQDVRPDNAFLKILSNGWICHSNSGYKKDLLVMHGSWFFEWDKIKNITSKEEAKKISNFIKVTRDDFRPPYARNIVSKPRRSIIVGTTNKPHLFADNRCFFVIPISIPEIDIASLTSERDAIWSMAVKLYKEEEKWWFDKYPYSLS